MSPLEADRERNPYSPPGAHLPDAAERSAAPRIDAPENQLLIKGCIFLFLLVAISIGLLPFLALLQVWLW